VTIPVSTSASRHCVTDGSNEYQVATVIPICQTRIEIPPIKAVTMPGSVAYYRTLSAGLAIVVEPSRIFAW